ncbi:MAG: hypothetical protein Q4D45_06790 [Lachnospiraceae bacterium]|nr:hypothetical protein [Lachnospiraceae bacterium]
MYRGSLSDVIRQIIQEIRMRKGSSTGKTKKQKKVFTMKNIITLLLTLIIILAIAYYVSLPAITTMSTQMWYSLIAIFVVLMGYSCFYDYTRKGLIGIRSKIMVVATAGLLVFFLAGALLSSPIVSASKYAGLMDIKDEKFVKDIPETDDIKDIALMDTESAAVIGQRAVGSLSDVVSQYEVSPDYTQLDLNGKPMKVSPLEYAGFFKWFNNKKDGIPGYVMVDPLENEAKYVKLKQPMKYSMSAYFGKYLPRHLRFRYPTAVFEGYYFEIDEDGNPYYICPVLKANAGLFGARDVKGVVICNPCTGDTNYYKVADIPQWVDHAFDGELMIQKYRWKGTLSGGFINSIIGNKGCKQPTDDYGYKVMDGDVWMYTGVTSVNGDQSNIAFVLMNGRTGESKYYPVVGCDENSAMSAAEGQVQHLNYTASFPALININNQPTYIMVLKDKSQLVKMYAMVNVEKYNVVATGTSQKEVLAEYRKMMSEEGIVDEKEVQTETDLTKQITVLDVNYITNDGDSYIYLRDQDNVLYKEKISADETVMFIKKGDRIEITYEENENKINTLISWK